MSTNLVYQQTSSGGIVTTANSTLFHPVGNAPNAVPADTTTEAHRSIRVRTAGKFSKLQFNLNANSAVGTSSLTIRKNGVDTSMTVSIPASTTGDFADFVNTATVAAAGGGGDDVNYKIVTGGASGTLNHFSETVAFENTEDTNIGTSFLAGGSNLTLNAASQTAYLPPTGVGTAATTTESFSQLAVRSTYTIKRLYAYVSSNARTTTTTIRTRKSAANGAQSISIGSSATGVFEDTTNTDSFVSGNLLAIQYVTGSGTQSLVLRLWKVEADGATAEARGIMAAGRNAGQTYNQSTTVYTHPGGAVTSVTNTAPSRVRTPAPLSTITALSFNISANNLGTASTFRIFKAAGGGDTSHTLSIAANTTGQLVSGAAATSTDATDDFLIKLVMGGSGTQTIVVRNNSIVANAATPIVKQIDDPSISITESLAPHKGVPTEMLHVQARISSSSIISAGFTYYTRYGSGNQLVTQTESETQTRIRTDGAIANLHVRVSANSLSGGSASTSRLRKDAANTNLSVSISNATTGDFTDVTNSVTLTDTANTAQVVNHQWVVSATSGTCTIAFTASTFAHVDSYTPVVNPGSDTIKSLAILASPNLTVTTANTTGYGAFVSVSGVTAADEGRVRLVNRIPSSSGGTITTKNFLVKVASNDRTTTTTFNLVKNGANGNQSVSVGALATGIFEDTSNTDTLAENDYVLYSRTPGAGTETLSFSFVKIEIEQSVTGSTIATSPPGSGSTTLQNYSLVTGDSVGDALAANTTYFLPLAGSLHTTPPTVATNSQALTLVPLKTIWRLAAYINQNSLDTTASTIKLYKNGLDVNTHSLSIPTSTTGAFVSSEPIFQAENTSSTSDTLAYKIVTGTSSSGAHTITPTQISVLTGPVEPPSPIQWIDEPVSLTEEIAYIRGRIKQIDESIGLTEEISYVRGRIKQIDEFLSLTETNDRLRALVRVVDEPSIGLTETVDRLRALSRVIDEPIAITEESVDRLRQLVRQLDESVTVAETTLAIKGITKVVDELISITETAPATIKGKTQVIDEALSILETIVTRLDVDVVPPQVPPELRVGGRAIRKKRRLRIRKGYRLVHLGPRYYLPPGVTPQPRSTFEPLKLLDQQKLESRQQLHKVRVSCTCRYSISKPAVPSVESIIRKLEARRRDSDNKISLRLLQEYKKQRHQQRTRYETIPEPLTEQQQQQQVAQPPIQLKSVSSSAAASYDIRQLFAVTIPSSYTIFQLVNNTFTSTYSILTWALGKAVYDIHKAISKDHEQKMAAIKQIWSVMELSDSIQAVSSLPPTTTSAVVKEEEEEEEEKVLPPSTTTPVVVVVTPPLSLTHEQKAATIQKMWKMLEMMEMVGGTTND